MSLLDVWQAAANNPFQPTIGKESHFKVGFGLLFLGKILNLTQYAVYRVNRSKAFVLTCFFGLSMSKGSLAEVS